MSKETLPNFPWHFMKMFLAFEGSYLSLHFFNNMAVTSICEYSCGLCLSYCYWLVPTYYHGSSRLMQFTHVFV